MTPRQENRTAATDDTGLAAYHPSWSTSPVASWLVEHDGKSIELGEFLKQLCLRLVDQDVAVYRVTIGIRSMHPEVFAKAVLWNRGEDGIVQIDRSYETRHSDMYANSPVKLIHDGAGAIRRRLEGDDVVLDFPILQELVEIGCTDYVIMPIHMSNGRTNFISWTTDQPGGFTTPQLTLLYDLLPLISLRVELEVAYEATRTLLNTYLGHEPARRVLAGSVRRKQVEDIRAAVFVSDMRGFTRLADRHPPDVVISALDDYFETLARPIETRFGEVLKFIGDGMLAIFDAETDPRDACCKALAAAMEGLDRLTALNARRVAAGQPEIRVGIGLHLGDVQYGNVGARDRLDFTVIGPAVNEASRVETLCKVMRRPLLASAAFAEAQCGTDLVSLGFHALRGVAEPQEIFGLPGHDADA